MPKKINPLDKKMKAWIEKEYPQEKGLDWKGKENYTFRDLTHCLMEGKDVYDLITGDSVIREYCFAHLSEILHLGYSYIYKMWLDKDYDVRTVIKEILNEENE